MAHSPHELSDKKKVPCRFFDNKGRPIGRGCHRGSECWYLHPPWPEELQTRRDYPEYRNRPSYRTDMDFERTRRRPGSPPRRRRSSRSLSPPPRGTTGSSRRDFIGTRRDSGDRFHNDYRGHRRTGSNNSNENYNKPERRPDPGWYKRVDTRDNNPRLENDRWEETQSRHPPVREAGAHSGRHSGSTEGRNLTHSVIKTSHPAGSPHTIRGSETSSVPSVNSKAANEAIPEGTGNTSSNGVQEIPVPNAVVPKLAASEETELINNIWYRRIGTLGELENLLKKKDELAVFLKEARKVSCVEQGGSDLSELVKRLEGQIQKADALIAALWQDLLRNELELAHNFGGLNGTTTQQRRLGNAEDSVISLEENLMSSEEDAVTTLDPSMHGVPNASRSAGSSDLGDDPHLEDLKIEELEEQVREREAELEELEFGFDTETFQNMVTDTLDKLKRHGRIGTLSKTTLSKEEEQIVDELGAQMASALSWSTDFEARMRQRDEAEAQWMTQYKKALDMVESGSNAAARAENILQQGESRLAQARRELPSVQDQQRMADHRAEEVLTESSIQLEQHWRQLLDSTRRETRSAFDGSVEDFKAFLTEVETEERRTWEANERKIYGEISSHLQKTFKWQDAVVKWLKLVESNKKATVTL